MSGKRSWFHQAVGRWRWLRAGIGFLNVAEICWCREGSACAPLLLDADEMGALRASEADIRAMPERTSHRPGVFGTLPPCTSSAVKGSSPSSGHRRARWCGPIPSLMALPWCGWRRRRRRPLAAGRRPACCRQCFPALGVCLNVICQPQLDL